MPGALDDIIDALHAERRLRVWSIIVTVFGDLVQPASVHLPARVLNELMDRMRIGPGTVRAALSRLAGDGWVERHRDGRNSAYRLTGMAAPAFEAATRRIYALSEPQAEIPPKLLILPDRGGAEDDEHVDGLHLIRIRRNIHVWTDGKGTPPAGALIIGGTFETVPDWVRESVTPPAIAQSFRQIERDFSPLVDARLDGLEAVVARILLVHGWRRALLRHPTVPAPLRGPDWPEAACRAFVATLHRQLTDIAAPWIMENLPIARRDQRFH